MLVCGGCIFFTPARSTYGHIHEYAINGDATKVAEDLATNSSHLNAPDDAGETPLHLAALHCRTNVITVLLDRKAKLDSTDNAGATPLHLAAQEGCADGVTMLLAKGAKLNPRDQKGRTPLKRAEEWHQDAVANLIRERGGTE